jgi:cytochrome c-type biogenesis protein CcmI
VSGNDVLPTVLGIVLVAAAAVFVLLPFGRAARVDVVPSESSASDRLVLYRQVLELELDLQLGKLSAEDYSQQSSELLARAGQSLREESGHMSEVDAEIEREIAAARAAFAAARATRGAKVGTTG